MALGSPTWAGAQDLWAAGGVSTPTPLNTAPVGDSRPYYPVWWKVVPTVDTHVTMSTVQSTSESSYGDTYMSVYTGDSFETSTYVTGNDDSGGNGRSLVEMDMTAGTVYHVVVGSSGSDGSGIVEFVLDLVATTMSEWIQTPDVTRTDSNLSGNYFTIRRVDDKAASSGAPDGGLYSSIVDQAWTSLGSEDTFTGVTGAAVLGPGVSTKGIYNAPNYDYSAGSAGGSNVREVSSSLAAPSTFFGIFNMEAYLPDDNVGGVGGIQLESNTGEVLTAAVSYSLVDTSYDQSQTVDKLDALGSWTHRLTTPTDVIEAGAGSYLAELTSGVIDVTGHLSAGNTVPFTVTTLWGGITARDPAFPFGGSGGTIQTGSSQWTLGVSFLVKPPRFRYRKALALGPAPEPAPYVPVRSLRQLQRGGTGGIGGIPRAVGNPTRQASPRRGSGTVL